MVNIPKDFDKYFQADLKHYAKKGYSAEVIQSKIKASVAKISSAYKKYDKLKGEHEAGLKKKTGRASKTHKAYTSEGAKARSAV